MVLARGDGHLGGGGRDGLQPSLVSGVLYMTFYKFNLFLDMLFCLVVELLRDVVVVVWLFR